MIVVADSGPIHYLVLTGDIDVLQPLFNHVLIPQAVRAELVHARTPAPVREWIHHLPAWAEIRGVQHLPASELSRLGPGEHEAILLSRQVQPDYLLIDDARGRSVAESERIRTIGTIGILREAAAAGLIDFASSFKRLTATNFRLSASFHDRILDELRGND